MRRQKLLSPTAKWLAKCLILEASASFIVP